LLFYCPSNKQRTESTSRTANPADPRLYCVCILQVPGMPVMPPGYGPPGMPPFQPVAMPTGQPMGYPGGMPGIPASYPPQLTQQNMAQSVTAAFQPIPNTGSPVVMSKEL